MELDQDLLNLWLQAEHGLSTGQARRLIELMQEGRNMFDRFGESGLFTDGQPEWWNKQWGLDLQTPSASSTPSAEQVVGEFFEAILKHSVVGRPADAAS